MLAILILPGVVYVGALHKSVYEATVTDANVRVLETEDNTRWQTGGWIINIAI